MAERTNVIGDSTDVSPEIRRALDATYAFLVPSDTRGGIISIGPVTTTGDTYFGYLNSDPPETLEPRGARALLPWACPESSFLDTSSALK